MTSDATLFRAPAAGRSELMTSRGPVLLRPVSPLDLSAVDTFVRRLGAAARFRRFHSSVAALTPRQLAGLVDVDHHERETMVVIADGRVVGLGQYLLQRQPAGSVELALVVAEEWQGLGIGRRLMGDLATSAKAVGCTSATVLIQGDNRPALHLLRSLAADAEVSRAGTVVEARMRL